MAARTRMTVPTVTRRKVRDGEDPLVMVTAYDAPGARIADEAGVDMILVGDSVAMVVLGYDDTLQVTVEDLAHHTAAVARAKPSALIVGDLPWMSYHVSAADTVRNAASLIRAGAQCVKLEGGRKRVPMIEALVDAEIPVMGHLGLTPQSMHAMGGFKVQARESEAALQLVADAKALQHAGCFAIVLEGVPDEVAGMVTEALDVPDDRHRRRRPLRRPGAGVPRPAGHRGPRLAEVRAPLRLAQGRCGGGHDARSPPTCAPGRSPSAAESYHLSAEQSEALSLYGGVGADGRRSHGRRSADCHTPRR